MHIRVPHMPSPLPSPLTLNQWESCCSAVPLRYVCTPQRLSDYHRDCAGRGREGVVSHITPPAQMIEIYLSISINNFIWMILMSMSICRCFMFLSLEISIPITYVFFCYSFQNLVTKSNHFYCCIKYNSNINCFILRFRHL